MAFLTTSTITLSCLASAAPKADSWSLGHVKPDDVIIEDIACQALDIFLHGPESAHKNGIVKTFNRTSTPINPCTLLKEIKKKQQNAQLTKHDAFVYWSSSFAVCWWPIFRKLGSCSTTDALLARTLLTKTFVKVCNKYSNIARHKNNNNKKRSTHET